jgi:hypothetical protein
MEQPVLQSRASDRLDTTDHQARGAVSSRAVPAAWLEMLAALEVEFRPLLQPGPPELQRKS